jgi:hypothetical protein
MNVLQWHIIDGQSFPLESKLFPQLSTKGRYCPTCTYSQDEIKAFIAFANERGVRVIPELDIPGHSGFQYGMPEIVACPYYEASQGSDRALDPTLDQTYTFLIEVRYTLHPLRLYQAGVLLTVPSSIRSKQSLPRPPAFFYAATSCIDDIMHTHARTRTHARTHARTHT